MRKIYEPKLTKGIERTKNGEQIFESWVRYPTVLIQDYFSDDADLDRIVELWLLEHSYVSSNGSKFKTSMITPKQITSDLGMKGRQSVVRVEDSLERISEILSIDCVWLDEEGDRRSYEQEIKTKYVIVDHESIDKLMYSKIKTKHVRARYVSVLLNILSRIPYGSKKNHDLVCFISQEKMAEEIGTSRTTARHDMEVLLELGLLVRRKVRKFDGDCYYVYARGGDDVAVEKYCTRIVNEGCVLSYAKD